MTAFWSCVPCVVTGSSGFIGRRLVDRLRRLGADVSPWARGDVDLRDRAAVSHAMNLVRPQVIFHLAATGLRHEEAHNHECIAANVAMAANVLASAPRGAVLVATGTMSEYGRSGLLSEDGPCAPETAYGIAKLACSHFLCAYGPKQGVHVRVARLFGVYGPGERPDRLFPSVLEHLSSGTAVDLSDGLQVRDFVHVDDVCEGLIRLATLSTAPTLVNLCTGAAVQVGDVCRWIAESLGSSPHLLRFGARPRSPGDADALVGDTTRLQAALHWVPPQRLHPGADFVALLRDAK